MCALYFLVKMVAALLFKANAQMLDSKSRFEIMSLWQVRCALCKSCCHVAWLRYAVLCCAALCCAVLGNAVPCCAVLRCAVWRVLPFWLHLALARFIPQQLGSAGAIQLKANAVSG